jgi:type II secretory ATPase GspE/PulE/Tfp pilus assembly ATPase PilB-like protein
LNVAQAAATSLFSETLVYGSGVGWRTTVMSRELESLLLRSGALNSQELARSIGLANARKVSLWDFLVHERRVPEETLADAFSHLLNLPRVRLDSVAIEAGVLKAVTLRLARKHTCLPLRLTGKVLVLAMANPLDRQAIKDVEFASSRPVRPVVACRTEILGAILRHYSHGEADGGLADAACGGTRAGEFEAPVASDGRPRAADVPAAVELCDRIIHDAVRLGSSDIHVEPGQVEMCVRLRVDGVLRDHLRLPRWMHAALLSRIKVLAKLDIAQQRLPQDGRIKIDAGDRAIDLRVSTLPTHLGEKAVLRVLGSTSVPALDTLGLSADEMAVLDEALSQPQGLVLVTGPTGAGKSTTLYSMLTRRQSPEINVVTIEDPIEYQVPGTSQVQVDVKAGLTFAGCLRAILRQDPDVILVGEIRDGDTAEIAFQAALTGHLVFSTLHTNDSVGAIERLLDLGVKPLLMTTATNLIVAQRLVRRICVSCRERYVPSAEVLARLQIAADDHEFQRGGGCDACAHTGYAGRLGIFEFLKLTRTLKDLIARRAPEGEIRQAAEAAGTRFLIDDALEKVRQGLTTVEEIQRVVWIDRGVTPPPPMPFRQRRSRTRLMAERADGASPRVSSSAARRSP